MKRSEMIKKVTPELVAELCHSFTEEDVSDMLKIFENAGMLPPGISGTNYHDDDRGWRLETLYQWNKE
jgi:hypothetical protein